MGGEPGVEDSVQSNVEPDISPQFSTARPTMSRENSSEQKQQKIELRGKRPPGVIGEMKPEKALEMLKRWREEGSLEEEERTWKELDRILREDPV
jgi:hypothetical protein